MTASKSYSPRTFPGHPGDCILISESEPCWGRVTYCRFRGALACEGHQKVMYVPEPLKSKDPAAWTAKVLAEAKERIILKEQQEALKEVEWQNRGDTLAKEGQGPHPCWSKLSDVMLLGTTSMLGAGAQDRLSKDSVRKDACRMYADAMWECEQRQLTYPRGYYEIKLATRQKVVYEPEHDPANWGLDCDDTEVVDIPEEQMDIDLTVLTDRELTILYGCAGQVVDYSGLERGARQVCMLVWYDTEKLMKTRGLRREFLFDLEA